jgi:hypothetical protein
MCRVTVDVLAFASARDIDFLSLSTDSGRACVLFVIPLVAGLSPHGYQDFSIKERFPLAELAGYAQRRCQSWS